MSFDVLKHGMCNVLLQLINLSIAIHKVWRTVLQTSQTSPSCARHLDNVQIFFFPSTNRSVEARLNFSPGCLWLTTALVNTLCAAYTLHLQVRTHSCSNVLWPYLLMPEHSLSPSQTLETAWPVTQRFTRL